MKLHTEDMSAKTTDDEDFLRNTFSDINANLLTREAYCADFIKRYTALTFEQRGPFLCLLAQNYGMDKNRLWLSSRSLAYMKDKEHPSFLTAADGLRQAVRPKHKTLFTHIGRVSGGVKFLVDLRADILNLKQINLSEMNGALYQELNGTLKELLMLWFTVGFLNLERITWNSPCDLVQKVSNYEAVHRIRNWADIKQRVGPYRRCYIFTHNAMPREPMVVLHIALTSEISSSIESIIHSPRFGPSLSALIEENTCSVDSSPSNLCTPPVTPITSPTTTTRPDLSITSFASQAHSSTGADKEDPAHIQCAVFYSITSTQKGLQGIDLGNYLIKSAVRELKREFPHLQQFSSLSPIPGFREWLLSQLKQSINASNIGEDPGVPLLLPQELSSIEPFRQPSQKTTTETFRDIIVSDEWYKSTDIALVMRGPLMRLCANYLYVQKRRSYALNPVANFHLSNGAVLWRINFLADKSPRGKLQSCTMMVNYRYFLDSTDTNARSYLEQHHIVASPEVLSLLQS